MLASLVDPPNRQIEGLINLTDRTPTPGSRSFPFPRVTHTRALPWASLTWVSVDLLAGYVVYTPWFMIRSRLRA